MINQFFLNNTSSKLDAGISSSSLVITVPEGNGDLLGTNFPLKGVIQEYDTLGRVIKREFVRITGGSNDIFNIVRAVESCPASWDATTHTQTAFSFSDKAIISIVFSADDYENFKDEINGKLNISDYSKGFNISMTSKLLYGSPWTKIGTFGSFASNRSLITIFGGNGYGSNSDAVGSKAEISLYIGNGTSPDINMSGTWKSDLGTACPISLVRVSKVSNYEWDVWVYHSGTYIDNSIVEVKTSGTFVPSFTGGSAPNVGVGVYDITKYTPTVDIVGLTEDTNPDINADFLSEYDASSGTNKKVKIDTIRKKLPVPFGGDGSDGSITGGLTITGTNNTLIVKNYQNFAPGANTVTITPTGCVLLIKVAGNLDLTGTTLNFAGKGMQPLTASGTTNGQNGASQTGFFSYSDPVGGTAVPNAGYTYAGGGGGGASAFGQGGTITSAGGIIDTKITGLSFTQKIIPQMFVVPQSGARGYNPTATGAGAGSGGGVVIFEVAGNVTFSGTTINCNGTAGLTPTSWAGGGGGGGGGTFVCLYNGTLSGSVTPNVSGGVGGGGGPGSGNNGTYSGGAGANGAYLISKIS